MDTSKKLLLISDGFACSKYLSYLADEKIILVHIPILPKPSWHSCENYHGKREGVEAIISQV